LTTRSATDVSGTHDNWFHERESAWLYGRVAAAEPDPRKRDLFLSLAAAAERQAIIDATRQRLTA